MDPALPLVERKQKAARQRIVLAAAELFAQRGFDGVSVSDIAELAEVGRTTFFRHFGDKQEVVFAREQDLLDTLTDENLDDVASRGRSLRDGLLALQPLVLRLCAHITADPEDYRQHERLVESNVELRARSAAEDPLIAARLGRLLVDQGGKCPSGTSPRRSAWRATGPRACPVTIPRCSSSRPPPPSGRCSPCDWVPRTVRSTHERQLIGSAAAPTHGPWCRPAREMPWSGGNPLRHDPRILRC